MGPELLLNASLYGLHIETSDGGHGVFEFSSATQQLRKLFEGIEVQAEIVRRLPFVSPIEVRWAIHRGNATGALASTDWSPATGVVSFGQFDTLRAFTLLPAADGIPELDESFALVLSSEDGLGERGATTVLSLVVPANDRPAGTLGFRQDAAGLAARGEEGDTVRLTVQRTGGTLLATTGYWTIPAEGNNTGVGDQVASPLFGSFSLAAGETEAFIDVQLAEDR